MYHIYHQLYWVSFYYSIHCTIIFFCRWNQVKSLILPKNWVILGLFSIWRIICIICIIHVSYVSSMSHLYQLCINHVWTMYQPCIICINYVSTMYHVYQPCILCILHVSAVYQIRVIFKRSPPTLTINIPAYFSH